MAKISIEGAGNYSHHYPRTATIVTVHAGGKDNCMAVAWHSSISFNPPLFGVSIAPKRRTMKMIREAGEFGVNFMAIDKAELVAAVGGRSGKEVDKFQHWHIEAEEPLKTSAPVLKDAYACYECRLVDEKVYGDHIWVVGEIVAAHYEEELFTKEQLIDLERVSPALYMGGENYTVPAKDNVRHLDRKVYGAR
jgi:flavin reductase (DIM6/NTAB) family NADH-FMN oxidoreductase RutF